MSEIKRVGKPKIHKCKNCRAPAKIALPLFWVCSYPCAEIVAMTNRVKARLKAERVARKELLVGREKLKSSKTKLTEALNRAQDAVNAFIRWRDRAAGHGCISCGKMPSQGGDFHAGHFLGRKAHPAKRFWESNIHLQCYACNRPNSGGIGAAYRSNLVARHGLAYVEAVEAPTGPAKFTIEDAQRTQAAYKAKLKALL